MEVVVSEIGRVFNVMRIGEENKTKVCKALNSLPSVITYLAEMSAASFTAV